jgi:hypothetical protein
MIFKQFLDFLIFQITGLQAYGKQHKALLAQKKNAVLIYAFLKETMMGLSLHYPSLFMQEKLIVRVSYRWRFGCFCDTKRKFFMLNMFQKNE